MLEQKDIDIIRSLLVGTRTSLQTDFEKSLAETRTSLQANIEKTEASLIRQLDFVQTCAEEQINAIQHNLPGRQRVVL